MLKAVSPSQEPIRPPAPPANDCSICVYFRRSGCVFLSYMAFRVLPYMAFRVCYKHMHALATSCVPKLTVLACAPTGACVTIPSVIAHDHLPECPHACAHCACVSALRRTSRGLLTHYSLCILVEVYMCQMSCETSIGPSKRSIQHYSKHP